MVAFKERIGDFGGVIASDPVTLLFVGGLVEKRLPPLFLQALKVKSREF